MKGIGVKLSYLNTKLVNVFKQVEIKSIHVNLSKNEMLATYYKISTLSTRLKTNYGEVPDKVDKLLNTTDTFVCLAACL